MQNEQILPESHPYFGAIKNRKLQDIEAFWRDGISVYASSDTKRDVLGQAFEEKDFELMELALKHGYHVDHAGNGFGVSALMVAIVNGSRELFDFFLSHGANVNHPDKYGTTAYLNAVACGDRYFIEELKNCGANTERITDQGVNDFLKAAENGHLEIMQYLLDQGRDINFTNCAGSTALVQASKSGSLEVVLWLLDHGADIDAKDGQGKTALQWAETNRHEAVAELLRQSGAK